MVEKPDLIVFTGDLIDSRRYNEKPSLTLIEQLVDLAPVYYVTGNHEWKSGKYEALEEKLKKLGVHILKNETITITNGSDEIYITGLDDPTFSNENSESEIMEQFLTEAARNFHPNQFHILLSHRPELFPLYAEYGFDLVFSGHAHGGQFRLPFIGGLVAPNQGLFPKYTADDHHIGQTTMIVSRGLGNSIIPVRIFNRPEIVVVTLQVKQ